MRNSETAIKGERVVRTIGTLCVAAIVSVVTSIGTAAATEIKVVSVGGVKGALDAIIASYDKATGNTVKATYGSPPGVSQKLAAGEIFDVVVQSTPAMNDDATRGHLKADSRIKVARGGIGMAVPPDATPPDISTPAAFKKTLLDAKRIAIADPATANGSGVVTIAIFEKAGLLTEIKPKLQNVGLDSGQQQIAKGEIPLGLFNNSEIRPFVKYVGPVPAELQQYTDYEAAITANAPSSKLAADFLQALAAPAAAKSWTDARLEPQR